MNKNKSPWNAIHAMPSVIKYEKKAWAQKRIQKMGEGYAIYLVNGSFYIGINGDYRCKL